MHQKQAKQKHLSTMDIKKRFHFNPKSQQLHSIRLVLKQKQQQKINKDNHDEFSSVKDNYDFNDSSWLTKLVNGIEELENFNGKTFHDISNLISVANSQIQIKNKGNQNNNELADKCYLPKNQGISRKTIPNIMNYLYLKGSKQNNKPNCQTQPTSSYIEHKNDKNNHIKTTSEDNFKKNANHTKSKVKEDRKLSLSLIKPPQSQKPQNQKLSKPQQKKSSLPSLPQKQLHKNSLINYSSIKQQQNQQPTKTPNQKQQQQQIIIDLDQISLRTDDISAEITPKQNKRSSKYKKENQKYQEKKNNGETNVNKQNHDKNNKMKNTKFINTQWKQKNNVTQKQSKKQNALSNCSQPNNFNNNYPTQQHDKNKLIHPISITNPNRKMNNINTVVKKQIHKLHSQKEKDNSHEEQLPIRQTFPQLKLSNLSNSNHGSIQSSYNQFLDTFKQQIPFIPSSSLAQALITQHMITTPTQKTNQTPLNQTTIAQPTSKGGLIKKNTVCKIKKQITKQQNFIAQPGGNQLCENMNDDQENRIPTFSERPILLQKDINEEIISTDRVFDWENQTGRSLKRLQNVMKRSYQERVNNVSGSIKKRRVNRGEQTTLQPIRLSIECIHEPRQSPKFSHCRPLSIRHQPTSIQSSQLIQKRLSLKKVFEKLNLNHEQKIHKYNLNENLLNIQEKYQFGAILSKIKYLDHTYTENQFIHECMKIDEIQILENNNAITHNNKQNTQMNSTSKIKINKRRRICSTDNEYLIKGKTMSQTKHQKFTALRHQKTARISKQKKTEENPKNLSQISSDKQCIPLFPETLTTCSQQLQHKIHKYSLQPPQQNKIQQTTADIELIIDNLNNKLTNYIQTNNLQDTYRKFKLDFVQLKRNMLY